MHGFSAVRESVALRAERALALATEQAGCSVQWPAIAAAWLSATGEPCPYCRVQPWWWVFEPSIAAERVVKEKRGACVYYRMAGGAPLSPPPQDRFNAFRERICGLGEIALHAALDRAGTQVTWREISEFWPVGGETAAPAALGQSWTRAFEPAVVAGRVIATKRGGLTFYQFSASNLPLPEAPRRSRRVMGATVERRSASVLEALEQAVRREVTMVRVQAIRSCWDQDMGDAPSWGTVRNDLSLLEVQGSVRAEHHGGHTYYAPAGWHNLSPPAFDTDLRRVEEAVVRATSRWQSAVPTSEIVREVDRDPHLLLRGNVTVQTLLNSLREHGRVRTVNRRQREGRELNYYAPPDGPHWVRSEVELTIDRRRGAIKDLWRRSGGRPFTTRCIRLFARSRPGYRLEGFPPYAWTNALHMLHRDEFLVRLASGDGWHCRWAVASDWKRWGMSDRERLMLDTSGRDEDTPGDNWPGVDPSIISRREDMRGLVFASKMRCRREAADEVAAQIIGARPVSLGDLRESRHLRPRLRITRRGRFGNELVTEAVRPEFKRKRRPITKIGVVGGRRYIDIRATPANTAYLRYVAALREVELPRHRSALARFVEARDLAKSGAIAIPSAVLEARAVMIATYATERARALRTACRDPDILLFEEERSNATAVAAELDAIASAVGYGTLPGDLPPLDEDWGRLVAIDDAVAWDQLKNHLAWRVRHPGTLAIRTTMIRTVDATLVDDPNPTRIRKRPAKHYLERVDFALYASMRCGGASLSAAARRAMHVAGLLRDPAPFAWALLQDADASAHEGVATMLGFFDEPGARRTLVQYIEEHFENGRGTVPGVECAAYALARSPFGGCATELQFDERDALVRIGRDSPDARLRWTASRVLRSWDQRWGQDQLLWL